MERLVPTAIQGAIKIHHVSYNYYGTRMAACTSDRKILIFEQQAGDKWEKSAEWSAHRGPIYKVSWAHPEYGQVIVSCSFDSTAIIWEEREKNRWKRCVTISDGKLPIRDAKFAPQHNGIILATACEDGFLRVYQAIDLSRLGDWTMMDQIRCWKMGHPCESLAFCSTLGQALLLAVGSSEGNVVIFENKQPSKHWFNIAVLYTGPVNDVAWAPPLRSAGNHLIGTAGVDGTVRVWDFETSSGKTNQVACFSDHQEEVWCVEWNLIGTTLISASIDGSVFLWRRNTDGKWALASNVTAQEET